MNILIRYFLLLVLCSCSHLINAQAGTTADSSLSEWKEYFDVSYGYDPNLVNGIRYLNLYPNSDGHQFLAEDQFYNGSLVIGNTEYEDVDLKYDICNQNIILQVSPGRIERIDVIDAIYVRGNMRYGGVISIISHEGDRAGVGLPGNSFSCNFKTFEPQQETAYSYSDTPPESERIPDFRNCLLWVPDIGMDATDKLNLNFTTSLNPGEYMVVVRGISNNGEILESQCNFIVQ